MNALWTILGEVNCSDDDRFLASDAQLVLLTFADGMIHARDVTYLDLNHFVEIMKGLVKVRVPRLLHEPEAFSDAQIQCLASSIRLLLDVFRTGISDEGEHFEFRTSTDNSSLADVLIGTRCSLSLMLIKEYLGLLHKYIPIQSLAKVIPTTATPVPSSISDFFKGMKRDIIDILIPLLHADQTVQDSIREIGGIPLILAQSNIDEDNPCPSNSFFCLRLTIRYPGKSNSLYKSTFGRQREKSSDYKRH